ncbi:unnamed protein product [Cylindrotheca closterium]|uniref:t-SNARE coiled-coil homology domain-containing protein n=1 Tax=Cylindrotheca closterium TaxID=2856 RepID=A0AAD2PUT0_9STRA|nr:unnamed protein product [Cylindrotheca closterium]
MSSVSFQRYSDEFKSLKKQVQDSLHEGFKDVETGDTGNLLSQCDELLQQMALEARSVADPGTKRELLQQVRGCKSELQALKDDHNKKSLMASARSGNGTDNRERLLQQQEMLTKQNSQLENARKVLEETEAVAMEIGEELSHNRETIESTHGRVRQVTSLTGRARRVVQSMNRRAVQQQMLLYGMAASVVIVFFVLVWWMR